MHAADVWLWIMQQSALAEVWSDWTRCTSWLYSVYQHQDLLFATHRWCRVELWCSSGWRSPVASLSVCVQRALALIPEFKQHRQRNISPRSHSPACHLFLRHSVCGQLQHLGCGFESLQGEIKYNPQRQCVTLLRLIGPLTLRQSISATDYLIDLKSFLLFRNRWTLDDKSCAQMSQFFLCAFTPLIFAALALPLWPLMILFLAWNDSSRPLMKGLR